jgi:hypothetical protein
MVIADQMSLYRYRQSFVASHQPEDLSGQNAAKDHSVEEARGDATVSVAKRMIQRPESGKVRGQKSPSPQKSTR